MYFTVPAQTELLVLSRGAGERSSSMRATHTHLDWPQVLAPLACPSCRALASGPLRRRARGSGPVTQRLGQLSQTCGPQIPRTGEEPNHALKADESCYSMGGMCVAGDGGRARSCSC